VLHCVACWKAAIDSHLRRLNPIVKRNLFEGNAKQGVLFLLSCAIFFFHDIFFNGHRLIDWRLAQYIRYLRKRSRKRWCCDTTAECWYASYDHLSFNLEWVNHELGRQGPLASWSVQISAYCERHCSLTKTSISYRPITWRRVVFDCCRLRAQGESVNLLINECCFFIKAATVRRGLAIDANEYTNRALNQLILKQSLYEYNDINKFIKKNILVKFIFCIQSQKLIIEYIFLKTIQCADWFYQNAYRNLFLIFF